MKSLILRSKKAVFAHTHGIFGARRGEGFEFVELAGYDYASDARRIDWMALAKSGELYMKIYEEELAQRIAVVPLISGSLHFGYKRLKSQMLIEALTLIAHSALLCGEELTLFWQERPYRPQSHFEADTILQKIAEHPLIGQKLQFEESSLFAKLPSRSLLILVGDFLEPIDIKALAARHDVVAIAMACRPISFSTQAQLKDVENLKSKSATLTPSTLANHARKLHKIQQINLLELEKRGVDTVRIFEDESMFDALFHFFGSR